MQTRERARARAVPFALGAIVVVGAVLRLWRLGAAQMNFDESFTAMTGRLPIGSVFGFLRLHDSHPPLDYLLQFPLARLGANAFVFRLPAAICSIAALALFAWWMRDRGRLGILATGAMAICSFQLLYAREARMYGPMQLIGVASAVVAEAWLRAPSRRQVLLIGALTFTGLMTHTSMILMAIGLFALAGLRRDADSWRWRAGIAAGAFGWAALWGQSFLVQSRGGHSSWIPHTTWARFVSTVSALVISRPGVSGLVVAAIAAGLLLCRNQDRVLARVLTCAFVVPVVIGALVGLHAPVLIGRTFTVVAWGPLLAFAFVLDALFRYARAVGVATVAIAMLAMLVTLPHVLYVPGPTAALTELQRVARPGDVVAIQPLSKSVELDWTLGVRSDDGRARVVHLPGFGNAHALALTGHRPTGRIWLMQFTDQRINRARYQTCSRTRDIGAGRMICIRERFAGGFPKTTVPTISAIYDVRPAARTRRVRSRA
jgi:hypothetical protein